MLKKRIFIISAAIFLAAEAILGYLLQTAKGYGFATFAYPVVVLACLFNLLAHSRSGVFISTQIALTFTVCADLFLVVLDGTYEHRVIAMCFFSVTQLAYAARIYLEEGKIERKIHAIARIAVMSLALVLPFIVLGDGADALSVISVVYFANLVLNAVFAIALCRGNPWGLVFAVGLILCVGCDVFVGFGNIEAYLPIKEGSFLFWLANPGMNMAWVFYTPSQALLGADLVVRRIRKM